MMQQIFTIVSHHQVINSKPPNELTEEELVCHSFGLVGFVPQVTDEKPSCGGQTGPGAAVQAVA